MELMKYIKDKQGQRIGVVVSNQRNSVGYSLVHIGPDRFDPDLGLTIARGREMKGFDFNKVPVKAQGEINRMLDRSKRYFR
jgi:hypothetical protein